MAQLTREQILAGLGKRVERDVSVPSLGGTVRLRELGRAQIRQAGELSTVESPNGDGKPVKMTNTDLWNLALVAFGVVDPETHQPLFSFAELRALTEGDDPPLRHVATGNVAQQILDLSEVGPEWLKSGGTAPDA
jgi:hypothetical protein